MKKNIFKICASVCLIAFISGCSGEPTQEEIDKAVREDIKRTNEKISETLGETGKTVNKILGGAINTEITLKEVQKLSCKKAEGKGGYHCEVRTKTNKPLLGESEQTELIYFIRTDDGLKAIKE